MDFERIDALGRVLLAAFPDERGTLLARLLATWLEPDTDSTFWACVMCGRRRGGMGVAPSSEPFFGRAGGWDEAGGVRWMCLGCASEADALLGGRSLDGMLADVVRALRDDARAVGDVERAFAARPALALSPLGTCFACGREGAVAKGAKESICARCAATALVAFERGSASTR